VPRSLNDKDDAGSLRAGDDFNGYRAGIAIDVHNAAARIGGLLLFKRDHYPADWV
jgi:hypothetical protein